MACTRCSRRDCGLAPFSRRRHADAEALADRAAGVARATPPSRAVHQAAVALLFAGTFARGVAALRGAGWVRGRAARTWPHAVDTVLLLSAVVARLDAAARSALDAVAGREGRRAAALRLRSRHRTRPLRHVNLPRRGAA